MHNDSTDNIYKIIHNSYGNYEENVCSNCGAKLNDNANFCKECGEPIKQIGEEENDTNKFYESYLKKELNNKQEKAQRTTTSIRICVFIVFCFIATSTMNYMDKNFVPEKNIALVGLVFLILLVVSMIYLPRLFVPSAKDFCERKKEIENHMLEIENFKTKCRNEQKEKDDIKRIRLQIINFLKRYIYRRYKYELFGKYIDFDKILLTSSFMYDIEKKTCRHPFNKIPELRKELLSQINIKLNFQDKQLTDKLIDYGTVEIKENLQDKYNADDNVINDYVRHLEQLAKIKITNLLQPLETDYSTQAIRKEEAEDLLFPVNYFYEVQNSNIKSILKYGVNNLRRLKEFVSYVDNNASVDLFIKEVLKKSIYPSFNKKHFDIEYNPENKMLIIDYDLPLLKDLDNVKSVKYVVTKNSFSKCYFSEKEMQSIYDNLLYEITLRTIAEIFNCIEQVDTIVFNGILNYIDDSDGKNKSACIISVQTNRVEFLDINLSNVVPSACFRKLKGISSKELYTITPVRPIIQLNKNDKRFVEAYGVIDNIEEGMNLATMDWQDFENLIREVFEKYFSQEGEAEVKVTQSSRDGGVDAVVFDPDPIRGGKIVIQAKRYTNVVGVSAVRDLYGTVINEGAIKGILVTTADFGSDSHAFVKDKPITLINGSSLLYLLEKYGHKVRININEAKEYFKNNNIQIHANKSY